VVLVVLAAAVVSAGCGVTGREAVGGPASPSVDVPAEVRGFRSVRTVAPEPLPRRLRIPALGVDTRLERLGRDADTVEVPRDWQRAGWYREGPRPGGPGSAVILGHVDSPQGPAVFRGLAGLRPGTRVLVERADGSTVTFRVTRVAAFPRARLPVQQVYWPTVARELRLITCGGRYDRAAGGYQSNVVVFATAEPRGLGY
jgi:hypothetical protein